MIDLKQVSNLVSPMRPFLGSRVLPRLIYHRVRESEEAVRLLNELGRKCRIVAGCTDFIPAVRRGAWSFPDGVHLVDVKDAEDLRFIKEDGDNIRIGAVTRLSEILQSSLIRKQAPVLAEAVREMASLQIRNTGTIGGNLCMASPAADTAPPLLVLDAKVRIKGIGRDVLVPLTKFFLGPGKTIIGNRELLTEIEFPTMKPDGKSSWMKVGRRNAFTLSVVSVATWAKVEGGIFSDLRIALGAVAPTPTRAVKAEHYLIGRETSEVVIRTGAEIAASEINPISDVRASAEYRRDMADVLTKRALVSCLK